MAQDLGLRRLLLPRHMTRPPPRRPPRLPNRTLNATACAARPPSNYHRRRRPPPRVFVLSDLHTDYAENMSWVKRLSAIDFRNDVLLVAGDVAESFAGFVSTMSALKDRFRGVFFVPGNHDLWCRHEESCHHNSLEKLSSLLAACKDLGVETSPRIAQGLGIIPLFSWYHESFDKEKDITGVRIPSLQMVCKDFYACKWPKHLSSKDTSLAQYFDALNDENARLILEIQKRCDTIITFSHFLPRQELCPEKRMLFYPNLPKVIGSDFLEARIRSIHGRNGSSGSCHVFGHTHFCWDATIDGIRYIQAPLAYPRERERRRKINGDENWLPFCMFHDGFMSDGSAPCYWSDYYSRNEREPENTELAPWVFRLYAK